MDEQRFLKPGTPERYRIDPAGSHDFNFGNMVAWVASTSRFLQALASGNELNFVGVAMDRSPISSNIDNDPTKRADDALVFDRGIFFFNTTASEIYNHGDPVKCGADAQTIAKATVPTDTDAVIGFIWNPKASAAVTGAAGVSIPVAIMRRHPNFVNTSDGTPVTHVNAVTLPAFIN